MIKYRGSHLVRAGFIGVVGGTAEWIFAKPGVEAIFAALETAGTDWAREQLDVLKTKSPQAMKVSFRQLELGGQATSFVEHMALVRVEPTGRSVPGSALEHPARVASLTVMMSTPGGICAR